MTAKTALFCSKFISIMTQMKADLPAVSGIILRPWITCVAGSDSSMNAQLFWKIKFGRSFKPDGYTGIVFSKIMAFYT